MTCDQKSMAILVKFVAIFSFFSKNFLAGWLFIFSLRKLPFGTLPNSISYLPKRFLLVYP